MGYDSKAQRVLMMIVRILLVDVRFGSVLLSGLAAAVALGRLHALSYFAPYILSAR
jgi:hypothetical protein